MMARIVIFYGLGGAAVEWWPNGEKLLQQKFQLKRVDTLLLNWDQRQDAYGYLHGFLGFRGLVGDSFGAGSAAQYAADLEGNVDFVGGFQPSNYDPRAVDGKITVPANVERAHCIHDSVWTDTLGLGQGVYVEANPAKTKLLVTDHRGAHPDDWGYSQDLMFNEIMGQIG
jgi:hypothetical protein